MCNDNDNKNNDNNIQLHSDLVKFVIFVVLFSSFYLFRLPRIGE